jgi:hypothetical protein
MSDTYATCARVPLSCVLQKAYFKDLWNYFDLLAYSVSVVGELMLFSYRQASDVSRVVQATACVLLWFKLLYFCRSHEKMGPVGKCRVLQW